MKSELTSAVYFLATGRVQGVAYRYYASRAARELGVTGWIGNRPDGRVEGEVYGDAEAVETFLRRLRLGPPAARVDSLDERPITQPDPPSSFEIRY